VFKDIGVPLGVGAMQFIKKMMRPVLRLVSFRPIKWKSPAVMASTFTRSQGLTFSVEIARQAAKMKLSARIGCY